MTRPRQVRDTKAYRWSLWCLGILAGGVLTAALGIVILVATGNSVLIVASFAAVGCGVLGVWSGLFMLLRWAHAKHGVEGIRTIDALMQVRAQLDSDVRQLLGRHKV